MSVIITDLDVVKDQLDISRSDSSEDNRLQQMLNQAEQVIFSATGRKEELYSSANYTEFHDGTGRELLIARRRPLTSITAIYEDANGYYGKGSGAFPSSTLWTEGTHYAAKREDMSEENRGIIVALNSVWPEGRGNVKLQYEAGYTSSPDDLCLAVVELLAMIRNGAEQGLMLGGETFGRYAYRVLQGSVDASGQQRAIIGSINSIISRYRNVAI